MFGPSGVSPEIAARIDRQVTGYSKAVLISLRSRGRILIIEVDESCAQMVSQECEFKRAQHISGTGGIPVISGYNPDAYDKGKKNATQ
jgi:hypothetical protein